MCLLYPLGQVKNNQLVRMVSAEDSVKKYYQWLHLQRQWKRQYSEDPKLDAALHVVLQPEVLFRDGSDMSTIPFFTGNRH